MCSRMGGSVVIFSAQLMTIFLCTACACSVYPRPFTSFSMQNLVGLAIDRQPPNQDGTLSVQGRMVLWQTFQQKENQLIFGIIHEKRRYTSSIYCAPKVCMHQSSSRQTLHNIPRISNIHLSLFCQRLKNRQNATSPTRPSSLCIASKSVRTPSPPPHFGSIARFGKIR